MKKRVQAGWSGGEWRKVSGVNCNKREAVKVMPKVYKRVLRPIILLGLEMIALNKRLEAEHEVAESEMFRAFWE